MKYCNHSLVFALIISINSFSQNSFLGPSETVNTDKINSAASQTDSGGTDSISKQETVDSSDIISNPFLSGGEIPSTSESPAEIDGPEKPSLDIILDLGIGISTTLLKAKPEDISIGKKPNFLFDLGIIVPFFQLFYTEVSVRFLQLKYSLSDSISGFNGSYSRTDTDEYMRFLSAPINLGMRFNIGPVVPYFYASFEPAYLTSAGRYTINETYLFPFNDGDTGSLYYAKITEDKRTTRHRERHQIFLGGGIGLEISYGYGAVYFDGTFMFALMAPGTKNTSPYLKSSSMKYFPILLGIRFYL